MVSSSKDLTGTIIAQKYKLLKLLGEGGMGTVYQAQDVLVNRTVALKVLKSETDNEEAVRRFQREATIAARIDSPYCVGLLDFGVAEDRPFLVMPYVDGPPLSDVIDDGPLPPPVAIDIFLQICEGLEAAHLKGVVHRDIKPSNVILIQNEDGYAVKILDFGIAKLREPDATAARTMTGTGEFLGSPKYMSPEQCEGLPADSRSDVYSLGILMYETLTGEPPFKDDNVFAIIEKHRNSSPEPLFLTGMSKSSSTQLQEVIFRCLEKSPSERYQKVGELKADLTMLKNASSSIALLRRSVDFRKIKNKVRNTLPILRFSLFSAAVIALIALWSYWSSSLTIPFRERRISFSMPDALPMLKAEERAGYDKRYSTGLSLVERETGKQSDAYIRACEKVGDFFRARKEYEYAMKYYGQESLILRNGGLEGTIGDAELSIKEAECCLPRHLGLGIQIQRLYQAVTLFTSQRTSQDFAPVKLIRALFLKARCEIEASERSVGMERSNYLLWANSDFTTLLNVYNDSLKQRKELYPNDLVPILSQTGDYFLNRALTAVDSDAVANSKVRALDCYRAALEQCAGKDEFSCGEGALSNSLAMAQLINGNAKGAVESLNYSRSKLTKCSNFPETDHHKIRLNLADAFWNLGEYHKSLLERFTSDSSSTSL